MHNFASPEEALFPGGHSGKLNFKNSPMIDKRYCFVEVGIALETILDDTFNFFITESLIVVEDF